MKFELTKCDWCKEVLRERQENIPYVYIEVKSKVNPDNTHISDAAHDFCNPSCKLNFQLKLACDYADEYHDLIIEDVILSRMKKILDS